MECVALIMIQYNFLKFYCLHGSILCLYTKARLSLYVFKFKLNSMIKFRINNIYEDNNAI